MPQNGAPSFQATSDWSVAQQKAEAERDIAKATLDMQKTLATQQLEIVKAQQGLLAQLLPKAESKPLQGDIKASDKYEYIAEIVAYSALDELAKTISKKLGLIPEATLDRAAVEAQKRSAVVKTLDDVLQMLERVQSPPAEVSNSIAKLTELREAQKSSGVVQVLNKVLEKLATVQNPPGEVRNSITVLRELRESQRSSDYVKVLIVDQLDWASGDLPLGEVTSQMDAYNEAFEKRIQANEDILAPAPEVEEISEAPSEELAGIAPAAVGTALPIMALAALSSVADILGYFKTDYTIKGQAFDLKKEALISAVAGHLRAVNGEVYIAGFQRLPTSRVVSAFAELQQRAIRLKDLAKQVSTDVVEPTNRDAEELSEVIKTLDQKKAQFDPQTQQAQIESLEARIKETEEELGGANKRLREANDAITASDVLLAAFERFSQAMTSSADANTPPKLVQAAMRDAIDQLNPTYLLYVNILSGGGEAITRRKLFGRSGDMTFIGGLVACYVLVESSGVVVASGTEVKLSALDYNLSGETQGKVRMIQLS